MKKSTLLGALCLCSIVISCSSDAETIDSPDTEVVNSNPTTETQDTEVLYFPPDSSEEWKTQSIASLGWNIDFEKSLYDFLEEKETKAFIILKDGKIVIEKYFGNTTASENLPWYSAGKTLTAFMMGIAQQEALLDIEEASSTYLGSGWADITATQEQSITIKNHLTMTTGLDYNILNPNCTSTTCLTFLNTPDNFWYYHNAPYTLIRDIVSGATNQEFDQYFDSKLKSKIGMNGSWIKIGFSYVYYSTARSMARFGLLNLNKGTWNKTKILDDQEYFSEMTNTSQSFNQAYGYLWWLNGKSTYRLPSSENQFNGKLIPNAPNDLIAGLGKNDQKLYIVPGQNLVIVRMGNETNNTLLGPSSFDNELWEQINLLINKH